MKYAKPIGVVFGQGYEMYLDDYGTSEWSSEYDHMTDGFREMLLDKIDFIDILDEYNLEYWECPAGDFTHRMKCPLPSHDFGGERTASMFIDSKKNTFYCFGCNTGGTVIEFVKGYCEDKDTAMTLSYLAQFIELTGEDLEKFDGLPKRKAKTPEEMVETHVFRAGIIIRDHLESVKNKPEYKRRCLWARKQFERLDEFLDAGDEACEKAKAYAKKLPEYLRGKTE